MIRRATSDDLPRLGHLAKEFYAASRFLKDFDINRFCDLWSGLLSTIGVMFLAEDDGEIIGAIGGVIYPDQYSGKPVATEFFWFVRESSRGGGMRLYREFEKWARETGCRELRMAHMMDSMPEKLHRVYRRLGFEAAEVHYAKEL